MKNLLLSLALCLTAGLFAEPVRITGFEDNERQWKSANGKSGNALFTRISGGELPDGKHALEISFGGQKDIAPKMRHWGNVSFILPAKKIPADSKVIRFWIKGKNTKGYGIIVRLGNYIHMGTQNDKKAWIDFADGVIFIYDYFCFHFLDPPFLSLPHYKPLKNKSQHFYCFKKSKNALSYFRILSLFFTILDYVSQPETQPDFF